MTPQNHTFESLRNFKVFWFDVGVGDLSMFYQHFFDYFWDEALFICLVFLCWFTLKYFVHFSIKTFNIFLIDFKKPSICLGYWFFVFILLQIVFQFTFYLSAFYNVYFCTEILFFERSQIYQSFLLCFLRLKTNLERSSSPKTVLWTNK